MTGVVEVGCGLGDIGRLIIQAGVAHYHGLDVDAGVISAARHLSRNLRSMSFEVGSFEGMGQLPPGEFDTLLMLNWPHALDAGTLSKLVSSAAGKNIRYALLDCVKLSAPGNYRYRHTPESLAANGWPFHLRDVICGIDAVRDLAVFER